MENLDIITMFKLTGMSESGSPYQSDLIKKLQFQCTEYQRNYV